MGVNEWLQRAAKFPYADFKASDAAERASLAILSNFCDRKGIKHVLRDIEDDEELASEIVREMAAIIRAAMDPSHAD